MFCIILFLLMLISSQQEELCTLKTTNLCFYFVESSHFLNAEKQCVETYDGVLVHGEDAKLAVSTINKSHLYWIGMRKAKGETSTWQWVSSNTPVNDPSSLPWADNHSNKSIDIVTEDQCGTVFDKKLYAYSCFTRLNYALCQRPIRPSCHSWTFNTSCHWHDAECSRRVVTRRHDGDNERCDATSGLSTTSHDCNPDECLSCKLSPWTSWSMCQPYCSLKGFTTRFRFVMGKEYSDCLNDDLVENKTCDPQCFTEQVDAVNNDAPRAGDQTLDVDYGGKSKQHDYGSVVFGWLIIAVVILIIGIVVVVALIWYQKLKRKRQMKERLKSGELGEAEAMMMSCKDQGNLSQIKTPCKHVESKQPCNCNVISQETVSQSLDKLGFWCH